MTRQTTVYYTLKVERTGNSGPDNERRIEAFVEGLQAQEWRDKRIEIAVEGHDYLPITETID